MGKAIVSTPGGVNGLDLEPGRDFLLAASGVDFATAVRSVLTDDGFRQLIEQQARSTAESKYDWDRIAGKQSDMYRELVQAGTAAVSKRGAG